MLPLLQRSLKTRVTLFTLAIFVLSLWALAYYVSRMLRTDMEHLLGDQQLSAVALVAADIDQELIERRSALEGIAGNFNEKELSSPAVLQDMLDRRPILRQLFNGGYFVTDAAGTAMASVPAEANRVGINYLSRPYIARAIQEGKPSFSGVIIGKALQVPVFGLAVPVRNARGEVVGSLVGIISLTGDNFLDQFISNRFGRTGGYLLVARQQRLIVTATDKSRIMEELPAPGVNPVIDRFLGGFEGTEIVRNPRGVEVLASVRNVPVADWYVVSFLPTAEAFEPISELQRRMVLATVLLTLLAGGLTWWMLRRQLGPVQAAAEALDGGPAGGLMSEPLPVTSHDEIGRLIGCFNRLLDTLQERDQYQRALLDNFPFAVWLKDTESRFLAVNAGFVRLHGAGSTEDLVGKTDLDIVPADLAAGYRADDRAVMDSRRNTNVEEEIVDAGTHRWVETYKAPVIDSAGKLLGTVGFSRDITERKRIERELVELAERYRLANKATNDVIWDWDVIEDTQRWSEAGIAVFGWTEIVEHPVSAHWWVDRVHPDDQERVHESFFAAVNNPECDVWQGEYRFRKADGAFADVMDRGYVLRDEHGKAIRMIGAMQDITERKRTEAELAQYRHHLEDLVASRTVELAAAKDAAEAASRAKSTFLANMSHELRTPMNGVMGMIELASRRMADPKGLDHLAKAKGAADHLLGVLNDILDISKIEAERMVLEDVPLQIGSILENLTGVIRHKAAEKGLALETDLSDALARLPLRGDPLRLGQILLNLAGNAVKFTAAGKVVIRAMAFDERADAVGIRFEVSDTGIGIEKEAQSRLFQSFEQADGSMTRKYGGTGLGLAISKRLAQLMGGEIGLESTPGAGSTFWFTVRLARREAGAVPPAPGIDDAEARLRRDRAGARILLAEDEPVNREIACFQLEAAGLAVDIAEDGQQALDLARRNAYDLILMDMQMPVMNGIEATRAIRADSLNRATPVLAMTANAFDEDREVCLAAGMNEHLGKPVKPQVLFAAVLRWLSTPAG